MKPDSKINTGAFFAPPSGPPVFPLYPLRCSKMASMPAGLLFEQMRPCGKPPEQDIKTR
jgi:hypothetical protein